MTGHEGAELVPLAPPELVVESRDALIREALVFQLKLAVDGLKDVVLVPVVFVALVLDLAIPHGRLGSNLRRVFRMGYRFDRWLDLYRGARGPRELPKEELPAFDDHLAAIEKILRSELAQGNLSAKAKQAWQETLATRRGAQ